MSALPRLLSTAEVCAAFNVSRVTLWEWRKKGLFPAPVFFGAGRTLRWPEPVIAKFLEQRRPRT